MRVRQELKGSGKCSQKNAEVAIPRVPNAEVSVEPGERSAEVEIDVGLEPPIVLGDVAVIFDGDVKVK